MRITKKFFKESEQRNVSLNKDYYTMDDMDLLIATNTIDNPFSECYRDGCPSSKVFDEDWVVYLSLVKKIEVEPDEYGHLTTVAYLDRPDDSLVSKVYVNI